MQKDNTYAIELEPATEEYLPFIVVDEDGNKVDGVDILEEEPLIFRVTDETPEPLLYQSQKDADMRGPILIVDGT